MLNRRNNGWGLWPTYGGYGSSGDGIGAAMMGGVMIIGALIIVILVLGIWALIKAIDLVIRAWRQCDGKSRALRTALFTWFGLILVEALIGVGVATNALPQELGAEIAAGHGVVFVFASISLLITARSTELKYRQTFVGEPETLITKVLRRPWWTSARNQAA